jgi:mRNA interferase MazF
VIRGEIWTASGAGDYAGKPRPWLIVQSTRLNIEASVILCGFTTVLTEGGNLRPLIMPTPENGLNQPSRIMIDKISTLSRGKMGQRLGCLTRDDMALVEQALLLVLGFDG